MSCSNDGSARSKDRSRCAIDGSIVSASISRSRNHRSIAQRYLWIDSLTFVLLLYFGVVFRVRFRVKIRVSINIKLFVLHFVDLYSLDDTTVVSTDPVLSPYCEKSEL